ncbi:hypothetical protein KIPB_002971 [Kipferlia bialata]|uniref:Uncharacterized protein n=1 Tax=Kipferlia bialata TaxID=797122 RepID=A0A9K3GGM9_9EUKA|nr:hypothetical protein KIPB_002971 [Kipferlia bialata]|eukprot:g2971.t1
MSRSHRIFTVVYVTGIVAVFNLLMAPLLLVISYQAMVLLSAFLVMPLLAGVLAIEPWLGYAFWPFSAAQGVACLAMLVMCGIWWKRHPLFPVYTLFTALMLLSGVAQISGIDVPFHHNVNYHIILMVGSLVAGYQVRRETKREQRETLAKCPGTSDTQQAKPVKAD